MTDYFKAPIESLLPQAPPMLMVDELLLSDSERTISALRILAQNIFTRNGHFCSEGLIENMAQTAALRAGIEAQKSGNSDLGKAYIGKIKNLIIRRLPPVDSFLRTKVFVTKKIENFAIVKAEVQCEDKRIASCEMTILSNF
ncbi:MAG: hypothetical protein CSB06_01030 [Bacteroidia bacterium]|nr:MAG: hypothetical protein CSB06_01030 [Bacteroidia bacterium]